MSRRGFALLLVLWSLLVLGWRGTDAFVLPSVRQQAPPVNVPLRRTTTIHRDLTRRKKNPLQARRRGENLHEWDGDDLRRFSKWRRRWWRSSRGSAAGLRPLLMALHIAAYLYQVVTTLAWLAQQYPEHWPQQSARMTADVLLGNSRAGPWTRDFWFRSSLAAGQPHRYLTAGVLHGSLLHLVVNMDALRRVPDWVETGLGSAVFATTYVLAVVAGNIGHAFWSDGTPCVGASGGICGLYGLLYVALVQMGNSRAASQVLRGMGRILLAGFLLSNISNASHVAGFLGGLTVGLLVGPTYQRSYAARRKWSLEVDRHSRAYRTAMGFGVEPAAGRLPLWVLWTTLLLYALYNPTWRAAPQLMVRGLWRPGSLSFGW